jgi:hypothetical protein
LQETVNNIYSFLYNHFQYKIDAQLQNLYAISAAWHFRDKGFDCKTYSVLASSILQTLQIPHAFRMVKQGGEKPNDWSHVYVVVPNGNSHYVIDATIHSNHEVSYTQKYDYNMEHRGLASPLKNFNGLGCACQGKPIAQTGLSSPAVFSNTVQNFHKFLNELEKNGVSRLVTDKMLELVKVNVQNGIDPNMGEVLRKAFAEFQQTGINAPASAYGTAQTFYGSQSYAPSGLGAIDIGATVTQAATGDFTGATLGILTSVLPFDKTFGAVFANGFDLSCWGSSYSEQKAKTDLEKLLPAMISWSNVQANPTTESLDKFLFYSQAAINDSIHGQLSKYAKCSRKGHALRQKGVEVFRENMLSEFKMHGFQLIPAGKKRNSTWVVQDYKDWAKIGVEWDSYNVVRPKPVEPTPTADSSGKPTVDSNGKPITEPAKTSTGTLVAVASALILGAKLLL